ncbi:MAG: METTL5 family protein [Promethearchaeota archaeon]
MGGTYKKKDIISVIQHLQGFKTPKVKLEQYTTNAISVADFLYFVGVDNSDLRGNVVIDLGAGTGRLSLGALLFGAVGIVMVEIDSDAIEILKRNYYFIRDYLAGIEGPKELLVDIGVLKENEHKEKENELAPRDFYVKNFNHSREGDNSFSNDIIGHKGKIKESKKDKAGVKISIDASDVSDTIEVEDLEKIIIIKGDISKFNDPPKKPDHNAQERLDQYRMNLIKAISDACTTLMGRNLNELADVNKIKKVCIMNPPFGIQKRGADRAFLKLATRIGDTIYSVHYSNKESRNFIKKYMEREGWEIEAIFSQKLLLDHSYWFHKKRYKEILADIYKFKKYEQ